MIAGRFLDRVEETEAILLAWRTGRSLEAGPGGPCGHLRPRQDHSTRQQGAAVTTLNAASLIQYLADFEAQNLSVLPRAYVSHRMGWQGEDGGDGFLWGSTLLTERGTLKGMCERLEDPATVNLSGSVILIPQDSGAVQIVQGYHARGEFAEWRRAIAAIRTTQGPGRPVRQPLAAASPGDRRREFHRGLQRTD